MRLTARALPLAAMLAAALGFGRRAVRTPAAAPTPTPTPRRRTGAGRRRGPGPAAHAGPARPRAADADRADRPAHPRDARRSRSRSCPADNPFGKPADAPAAIPPKLTFTDATLSAGFFVSVHVDPTGKAARRAARARSDSVARRRVAEIVLALDVRSPARKAASPSTPGARTASISRSTIRSPKIVQMAFDAGHRRRRRSRSRSSGRPTPTWLDSRKPGAARGRLDRRSSRSTRRRSRRRRRGRPTPTRGRSRVKFWVRVDKTGQIDKAIPIEVSDPVLLALLPPVDERLGDPAGADRRRAGRTRWNELTPRRDRSPTRTTSSRSRAAPVARSHRRSRDREPRARVAATAHRLSPATDLRGRRRAASPSRRRGTRAAESRGAASGRTSP